MSNRPNYILELKNGASVEFTPIGNEAWQTKDGYFFTAKTLEALGATPVPQEEPVGVEYRLTFAKWGDPCKEVPLYFRSNEDAENYRRRCESIGPEWTDWEPKDKELCWSIDPCGAVNQSIWDLSLCGPHWYRFTGQVHPTKERAQEWLDRFGKAWGLM